MSHTVDRVSGSTADEWHGVVHRQQQQPCRCLGWVLHWWNSLQRRTCPAPCGGTAFLHSSRGLLSLLLCGTAAKPGALCLVVARAAVHCVKDLRVRPTATDSTYPASAAEGWIEYSPPCHACCVGTSYTYSTATAARTPLCAATRETITALQRAFAGTTAACRHICN